MQNHRSGKKNNAKPAEGGTLEVEILDNDGEDIRDPTATTSRGRPGKKKKKSGLHLKASKPVKCSVCGSEEHTSPKCPKRMTPGPEPMEQDLLRNMI